MTAVNFRNAVTDIVITIFAVVVIPSLIFYFIDQFWFIQRAVFNIDYLLVCLILVLFGPVYVAIGVATILVLDIVFSFAPAYHFSLTSILHSISDMFSLEPDFLIVEAGKVVALVLLGTISTYLSIKKTQSKKIVMAACAVSIIGLVLLDIKFSANSISERDANSIKTNIAASSINNLRLAVSTADQNSQVQSIQVSESASHVLWAQEANANEQYQSVILIVVESLGAFKDGALNNIQMAPVLALKNQAGIVTESGVMAFEGSTVPGELRELCAIKLLAVHPDISILPIEDCLPRIMGERGYETLAIHGFIGTMFSRNRWYPALAFDDIWFAPEIDRQDREANRCGIAFHGICDVDVWKKIAALVSKETVSKRFIYWLTLSAHLPVQRVKPTGSFSCSDYPSLTHNAQVCSMVLRHRQLFSEVAMSVKNGELKSTRIILVGDHSPPFLDDETRSLFSSEYVPYVDIQILR